ncbi:conserved hypothetical protein [Thiomonas sp. X19]|uniref:AsmA family protein n=1 Tax=Thiomonas sp. X19 TaxID=1050370 RepID=UPI000B6FD913|nr:AsmA family protein [Thiomonas sp. X19]SCC92039.1 conserved hypothetical protein [Thiomonas sp. X19]
MNIPSFCARPGAAVHCRAEHTSDARTLEHTELRQAATMGNKLIKSAVAALIAIGILVVGGVGLVLLAFDPNQYKAALISAVQERYHRTLQLPGTIELRLFPPFTLNTGPMRLSEPGSSALFAQASDMRLHLNLLALLQRQIVVDRIVLDAPHIVVQRNAQGQFNFDDLLPKADTAPSSAASPPARPTAPVGMLVRKLSINGGDIALSDARTGVSGRFSGLSLELSGLGEPALSPMSLSARATFTKPLLDANFSLKGQLQAAPHNPLLLQDFMLRSDGNILGIKKLLSNVSGSLSYTPAPAASPLAAAAGKPEPRPQPGRDGGLQLQNVQIKAQGQNAKGEPLQFDASLPLFDWSGNSIQSGALQARALLGAAPRTLHLELEAPACSGPAAKLAIPGLRFDLQQGQGPQAPGLHASLQGALNLDLPGLQASFDAARLQGSWRADSPQAQALTFDLQGRLSYAQAGAEASFALAGQAGPAKVQLTGASQQGAITLQADADRLDLDALLGTHATVASAQPVASKPAPKAGTPAAAPIDLSALKGLQLDARLRLGSLRFKGMQWNALTAHVRDDGDTLSVDPFAMQGYGGTLGGTLQVDLNHAGYALMQTARHLQIQPIIQALSGYDLLLGTADAQLALTTRGASTTALLGALDGTAQFEVRNGAIKGFNLAQSLRQAGNLLRLRQDSLGSTSGQERTDFSSLSVSFQLAQGVASSRDLNVQSPLLRVGGEGRVDLPARTLDYVLRPTLVGTPAGQDGPQAAALKGLTVPVRISGAFSRPQYAVLWSQAAGGAIESALKNRAEQELQKRLGVKDRQQLREQLQNRLKGLLR